MRRLLNDNFIVQCCITSNVNDNYQYLMPYTHRRHPMRRNCRV